MLRFLKIFSLCIICAFSVNAQSQNRQAPLNPDFVKYMSLKKSGEKSGENLGLIPSPIQRNFDFYFKKHKSRKRSDLPSKYDLREHGFVSSVKDQGTLGTCWSFASMATIESFLLRKKAGRFNFSEKNMVTCSGFEYGVDDGGFYDMAIAYIASRKGPVSEEDDKYYTIFDDEKCVTGKESEMFINSARFLPKDIELLKKIIMKKGAIGTTICFASTAEHSKGAYYSKNNYTFYYNGTQPENHAVVIVGWDDNKIVTGGKLTPKGKHKGAWIVKNSWGRSFGNTGYFYVSYKDTRFYRTNVIFDSYQKNNKEESILTYSELGATSSFKGENNTAWGVVKFNTEKKQFINKIGTHIISAGTVVDVEVYKNFDGDSTFSGLIKSEHGFNCDFPGYYTFDFLCPVEGEFYVKLKYYSPGYDYPLPVEIKIRGYASPTIEEGIGWRSENGKKWIPVGKGTEDEIDICINLCLTEKSSPMPSFKLSKKNLCKGSPIVVTNESYGKPDTYVWNFGEGAEPQTLTVESSETHEVVYTESGDKKISLTVKKGEIEHTFVKMITVEDENIDIYGSTEKSHVSSGKSTLLYAFGNADNYTWEPTTDLLSADSSVVECVPSKLGTYTYVVTGTQGNCTGSSKVEFVVHKAPDNDDVVNAIELKYDRNGPFSNKYATVEDNEPYPDTTSTVAREHGSDDPCNSQYTWCHEGGLHNSIWFKIKAKESGTISVNSYGFDNQLALYDAEKFEDLFQKGKYTLLAANDDYNPESKHFSSALTPIEGLTPGKYYWLQSDGSAGGNVGYIDIYVYDGALSVPNTDLDKRIVIFPNPTNEKVHVRIHPNFENRVSINISDIQGRTLIKQDFENISSGLNQTIDLNHLKKGVYNVQFIFEELTISKKLIIN